MSLSSSLFTGTSGLKNMGNALQVVGNNIANLNTLGFKRGRSTFADTLYESVATNAGTDQMGRGMAIGDVTQNFDQGSFESTGNTTDLSIGGDGFFIMRQSNSENTLYTRAGNFFFDKDGQLVNPEGYIVQGWDLDEETGDDVGAIKDLVLKAFTSPPKKSSRIMAITNLNADANSNSVVLSNNWDSGEDTYMAATNYEYQTVVKVYDTLGSTHDVTIFYDKKSGTEWEYIVTANPEEDMRNGVQGTDSKGLLARGNIIFSQSSGDILDFTMSEFTGRLGNFQANGANTVDAVHYEIFNFDDLANDGYGFSFEFDGTTWGFVTTPTTYPNAQIIYSDDDEINLILNQTNPPKTDADIKIHLEQPAVATDSIGFDINNPNDLHVQGIEGTRFFGETANDNTTLEINDPSVMTHDSLGLGIVWNPVGGPNTPPTGEWVWSNPTLADAAGTLIANATYTGGAIAAGDITIANSGADISMVATGINLRYDGAAWDWNDGMKIEDFNSSTFTFSPTNDPTISIINQGSEGAIATTVPIRLYWDENLLAWSFDDPATLPAVPDQARQAFGNAFVAITSSSDTSVIFEIDYGAGAAAATEGEYSFGSTVSANAGQYIDLTVVPTPPREYAVAYLAQVPAAGLFGDGFTIDFDADSIIDMTFSPLVATAPGGGDTFSFDTDPDVPPAEYPDATLKGDNEEAVIDLDGSGNDTDNDDIRFVFADSLKSGGGSHPYNDRSEISFDILGSTAWTEISKSSIEQNGYYGFTTDFQGGEYGSTENDIELDLGTLYKDGNFVNDSLSTTQYSKSSSTVFQDADGYSAGDLQGVDVASDGIMTGVYSNGQLIPLFRVGLAKFLNNFGLFNEGGNLFRETRASGSAITNKPGENGLGTIAPNSLEMSNVDIAEEFVSMITTQRGFQANSKTITTVDDMMQTVIQMKR